MTISAVKNKVLSYAQRKGHIQTSRGGGGDFSHMQAYYSRLTDAFFPISEYRDTIRLIPGEYNIVVPDRESETRGAVKTIVSPAFEYVKHYDARTKKQPVCSAGPYFFDPELRQPCYGCDIRRATMEDDDSGKKKSTRMGVSKTTAFSILHIHVYHLVPRIKDGKMVPIKNKPGEFYMQWERCLKPSGQKCPYCNDPKVQTVPARAMHFSVGTENDKELTSFDEELSSNCLNCGGIGTIEEVAWVCSNYPKCKHAFIDMDTTKMSKEDIHRVTNSPMVCPSCKNEDYPFLVSECSKCGAQNSGCNIFSVNIGVRKIKDADGKTVRVNFQINSMDPLPEELQAIAKPLDLAKIFAPSSLTEQAWAFEYNPAVAPGYEER